MSFVPNRDLKRLNPMSNDCYFGYLLAFLIKKCYNRFKLKTSGRKENMDFKRLVKELADFFGVSFASINKWKTGKHEPTTKIKRIRN